MTAGSTSEVVEQAVHFTGMRQVPVEDRTKLLSDRGSGYLARYGVRKPCPYLF